MISFQFETYIADGAEHYSYGADYGKGMVQTSKTVSFPESLLSLVDMNIDEIEPAIRQLNEVLWQLTTTREKQYAEEVNALLDELELRHIYFQQLALDWRYRLSRAVIFEQYTEDMLPRKYLYALPDTLRRMQGQIVELFVGRRYAVRCMTLLSCIPGIMNMSITAKTDSMTVFMQLVLLLFLLLYIRRQRSAYLVLAVDAYLMTLVLKPTALVFSTVAAGTAGLYILLTRQLKFRLKGSFLPSCIYMIPMWLLIWYRTWLHTGLPLTSVFNSIWAALGFTVRYPYRFESLPSNGGSMISIEGLKHILKRIYGVLMAPVGEDMAHVRIAWSTPLLLLFLLLVCLPVLADVRRSRQKEKNTLICLALVFVTNGLMSLMALYLLWQVDGNYFLLLYVLSAIMAVIVVGKLKSGFLRGSICRMLVPFILFNVTITAVSNWGGTLGLTPVKFIHKGYYDHMEESHELLAFYGNEKIWDILAENPRTRVVVFGEQPEMLRFPCSTQSYTDIEGSGGNFNLSSSPEALADFFTFAGVDYIYLGSGYLKPGTDGFRNVTGLLKQGYLMDLLYENGNGLAVFSSDPKNLTEEESEALLAEFTEKYWPGEQQ